MPRPPIIFFAFIALFTAMFDATPAFAKERLALIIGNGAYRNIPELPNPVNDAELMTRTLLDAGFRVTRVINADIATMERAVERFGRELRSAGPDALAIFYFAGHGVRSDGFNYLVPVGVNLRSEADIARQTVAAEWILERIEAPGVTSIMVLDACRNNPFDDRGPEFGDGLAKMNAQNSNLIAYATGPGNIALDGVGNNSPYTAALARAIRNPDLDIEAIFEQVRNDVVAATAGEQVPWESSDLERAIYIQPTVTAPVQVEPQVEASNAPKLRIELTFNAGPLGRERPDCNGIYRFDPVTISRAGPQRIAAANGIVEIALELTAGAGDEISIAPVSSDVSGREVTFRLSEIAPGKETAIHSHSKHPDLFECGSMAFFVSLVS